MNKPQLLLRYGAVLFFLITVSANAALLGRLPLTPGGTDYQAAYDTVLDITWLADAALSGNTNWENQLSWVDNLNSTNHLGFNDWRLASMSVAAGLPTGTTTTVYDCSTVWEPLCRDNELSYMFYHNLGGATGYSLTGNQTVGDVTLANIQPVYWSATGYAAGSAWITHFTTGFGVWSFKSGNRYGWAVREGDVGAGPVDTDGDQVADGVDNCILKANAAQIDTDGDGHGNACDGDFQNNCLTNIFDFFAFNANFSGTDQEYDLNSSGGPVQVNIFDLFVFNGLFGSPPGPSAAGLCP